MDNNQSSDSNGSSESPKSTKSTKSSKPSPRPATRGPSGLVLVGLLILAVVLVFNNPWKKSSTISYSFFMEQVRNGNVSRLDIDGQSATGEFKVAPFAPIKINSEASPEEGGTEQDKKNRSGGNPSPESNKKSTDQEAEQDKKNKSGETNKENSSDSQPNKSVQPDPEETTSKLVYSKTKRLKKKFNVTLLSSNIDFALRQELEKKIPQITGIQPPDFNRIMMLVWIIIIGFMVYSLWNFFRRSRDGMMGGGGMMSGIIKSPAKLYEGSENPITFEDVAGLQGVKKDLEEVVQFLKTPEKFQKLGARIPKGVLLMGPPGTGKTLLAKAIAGEADVPFYSINGSEFIQMFVGVGASRVRDMFKTAAENSPAILFIDEIDAVGRERGAGMGGGHDEREQTLNQILSEMDGFGTIASVIVIAATNRPDVLDPALLRPGRFDRHITVDKPAIKGRRELLTVHSKETPLSEDVDLEKIARSTVGMTGADIRNLINEAALWATRQDKNFVEMIDFEYARDKILMGGEREDRMTEAEKKITAYHEAGHALIAWYSADSDRVHKVTIVPRGRSLGVTQLVPDEDRHNLGEHEAGTRLAMYLAGRAAEKIIFEEFSAGAESDLKEATRLARRMVTHWGMSERLGPVAHITSEEHPFLGREMGHSPRVYSDHTAQVIDEEITKLLHAAQERARRLLVEKNEQLVLLSEALLEREILDEDDIAKLIGPSVQMLADEKNKK